MKTLSATALILMATGTQAMAATGGANGEGIGLLAMLFFGFCALIFIFQLIPSIILFWGMIKGILSLNDKKAEEVCKKS